jgi:hypothetical protein
MLMKFLFRLGPTIIFIGCIQVYELIILTNNNKHYIRSNNSYKCSNHRNMCSTGNTRSKWRPGRRCFGQSRASFAGVCGRPVAARTPLEVVVAEEGIELVEREVLEGWS